MKKTTHIVLVIVLQLVGTYSGSAQQFIPEVPSGALTLGASSEKLSQQRLAFEVAQFSSTTGVRLPYRLLKPKIPAPPGGYPLVLALHGSDGIGTDNSAQLGDFIASWADEGVQQHFPAYVVAPQFPTRSAVYKISPADGVLASYAGETLPAALELVDRLVTTLPIDPNRIYVAGFSMGSSTGWHALLLHPHFFAAAVLVSGIPPERANAAKLTTTPLLITHGNVDPENPFAPDRAMYAALRAQGDTVAGFREYDNMAHAVPRDMSPPSDATNWWRDWLFSQRRQPEAVTASPAR